MEQKKGQRHYQGYEEGDQVWLEGTNLKLTHPKAKLDTKRYGPFTITKKVSPIVFKLGLPQHWRIHDVFHASLLTPYKETEEHGHNFTQPAPELIEGEEEYEVEQVLNSRQWGKARSCNISLDGRDTPTHMTAGRMPLTCMLWMSRFDWTLCSM
jgi:hypothetical protein